VTLVTSIGKKSLVKKGETITSRGEKEASDPVGDCGVRDLADQHPASEGIHPAKNCGQGRRFK